LPPIVASFNRSYGLTDFVDAGELKESADYKLRALLSFYADNAQCQHMYFAGCHDVGYISELTPHKGNRARFTLINTPSIKFHTEFTKLGMDVEELPDVFRRTPLDAAAMYGTSNAAPTTADLVAGLVRTSLRLMKAPKTSPPTRKD
jgi:hypothetical protein